jgi:aminodeoxychorismate synthase component I
MRPVVRELPGWRDPLDVLPLFAGDRAAALLLSAGPPEAPPDIARFSFLASEPFAQVRWDAWPGAGDPFIRLEEALAPHACAPAPPWPFAGGAIGWIGYDARLAVEPVLRPTARRSPPGEPDPPAMLFGLYAWTIAWDHVQGTWAVIATGAPETGPAREALARDQADRVARRLEGLGAKPDPRPGAEPVSASGQTTLPPRRLARVRRSSLPREEYLRRVEAVGELIQAGELYQVNLGQRLDLPVPADPLAVFAASARRSPSPFAAWLDLEGTRMVCASPERFVRLQGRAVQTRPIKGTRPRGRTPQEDASLRAALAASAKDRSENVMIVDLERNDLGRVCTPGSVRVDRLCALESYAAVHHLVSVIRGELAPGRTRADLLRAMFPGGSMTGAPKVRAMQAIDDLEPVPRGIWSGSLGWLSFAGDMDLNIVIRTLVISGKRAWLHAGGGIVSDSVPADEFAESLDKARSMRLAVGEIAGKKLRAPRTRRQASPGSGRARRRSPR